jgi:2-amino-4-hydroxy-6-hydroxymethyldihydropteridine diphosphokinase
MADVLIALGGNVGDVRAIFEHAIGMLCADGYIRLIRRSADYRTPPWGVADQPDFSNAVIQIETSLSPHALLERTQATEKALGRDRAKDVRWGPRPIDIDIIAYGDVTVDEPDLKLPHPHLFERAFVLVPLAEIAPDRVIAGIKVRDALAKLDTSGISLLPPRLAGLV